MINIHTHIFTDNSVPERFLPLKLVRYLRNTKHFKSFSTLLHWLNPLSSNDVLDRYDNLLKVGRLGSQESIFLEMLKNYNANDMFVVLSMNMDNMGAGKVKQAHREQLEELYALSLKYEQIMPFIMLDPREKGILELLREYHDKGFKGIKLYPRIGYFPNDERLLACYEYAEKHNMPIIAHCTPNNPVFYKGSKKELNQILYKNTYKRVSDYGSKRKACAEFIMPKYYEEILIKYPKLKICLAHGGGEDEWLNPKYNILSEIKQLCRKHESLYFDCSFTTNNNKTIALLSDMLNDYSINKKILFGTDYYMNSTEKSEYRYIADIIKILGVNKFNLLQENNNKFLNI